MTDVVNQRHYAWRSARAMTATAFVGMFISTIAWHVIKGGVVWHWLLATAIAAAGLGFVLARRQMSIAVSAGCALAVVGAAMAASSLSTHDLAVNGYRFEAFMAYKLAAFMAAIIAPYPFWIGYLIMAVTMVAPVVQYFLMPDALRQAFSVQEPWLTTVIGAMALFVLVHRMRALAAERAMVRVHADKNTSDQIARLFLAMRDLTNTPLQSIALTSALLEQEHLDRHEAARHLDKALARLRELTAVLAKYDHVVDWSTTEASFDAVKDLERQMAHTQRPTD
jgi:hypothetical protein